MEQHVLLYEQFSNKRKGDNYLEEGNVFNMKALLLEEVSKDIVKKIKRGKSIWLKSKDWTDWKEYQVHSIIDYSSGDITLKLLSKETNKIWSFFGKDFKEYDATLQNPWEELIPRVSKKGPFNQKELKKLIRSLQLKKHTESEAVDILHDLIKTTPGLEDWVMTRYGVEKDYVVDFLYDFV